MLSPYRGILALPGARAFTLWGLVARLQMGLTGLSTFLLVQIEYGRYEYGGMVLAAIAVSYAVVSPQVGRLVDAFGQSRVLRWGFAVAILGRLAMIAAALTHQPVWVLVALAPLFAAGGTQSTHTRARWTHIVPDKHALNTAFSLESSLEEVLFIAGTAMPFLVRDADGEVVGSTRYFRMEPHIPRLEIGYTWYAQRAQRTPLNTEAKWLLLGHAFEAMGCAVVEFRTHSFNHRSRAAIERLGAKCDGILRRQMRMPDGHLRDTVVYSILDDEWPTVRQHLEYKLEHGARA